MKSIINLTPIPNQTFFVVANGYKVDFRLHTFRELLYADVMVDEEKVANSVRCVNRGWLLPERYNNTLGNFMFDTLDGVSYPNTDDLGTSCFLLYYSPDEIPTT